MGQANAINLTSIWGSLFILVVKATALKLHILKLYPQTQHTEVSYCMTFTPVIGLLQMS